MLVFLSSANPVFFNHLTVLAVLLLVGLLIGRLCEKIKIASITGYVLSGVIIGMVSVYLDKESVFANLSILSSIGLGILAFEIGTRLYFKKVAPIALEVVVITVFQTIMVFGLVFLTLYLFKAPLEVALVLGVIAMATSPGTVLYISRKYKAKGHLTDAIMPHIGLDDIFGVIIFSIVLAVAKNINNGSEINVDSMLLHPLFEIIGSVFIGAALGAILALLIRLVKKNSDDKKEVYLEETFFMLLLVVALTFNEYHLFGVHFVISPILTPMAAGIIFTNLVPKSVRIENDYAIDSFTPPFILAFFALIGIELVVALSSGTENILKILLFTVIYLVVRVVGKVLGAKIGGKIMHAHKEIKKYLGLCLLPQATVSLGMAQLVVHSFDETSGSIVLFVVLISGIVYELIGPNITRYFLAKANEIDVCPVQENNNPSYELHKE